MISFISSLQIINVVILKAESEGRRTTTLSKHFLWIAASVADDAAVCPNAIKTLLANGLNTLFLKGNPVLSNGP